MLASVWAMVIPFLALAAAFFIFGWWYSRPFYLVFFLVLFVINFVSLFIKSRRVIKVAVTSPDVAEIIKSAGAKNIKVLYINDSDEADVIVTDLRHSFSDFSKQTYSNFAAQGKEIIDIATFLEELTGKVEISSLSKEAEILLRPKDYIGIKRIWETALVLFTLPIWVFLAGLIALLVRLDSKGPILFKQRRIGLYGQPFEMYKFRSMYADSESNGPRFAQVGDSRVTRVGAILRKFRLDEIPQLWNVIKGDMSLIGPRPEQEAFATQFAQEIPFFETRHFVRPGLTGWAQVVHGYTSDQSGAKEKLAYDLYYVKNFSFWLDLLIIIKTLSVIFRGFGAR
ncbi:exopolysaccharide biosynthesis polyprenyl glycosylphosphotransferase [Meiothermus sp.]|uniref:exopolysaccharide biosynthesis polyprenyl glycosylphosphotransferase n=1 Tax=Meiothermus sp. TaxID=1955249 RepID=UPI0026348CDB|nr:exopolysaccharide biosynthesis polyprenyl glycosylphosphotransferase [Meiothermus sp.]